MKNKISLAFLASLLAILVPTPGRLAFGIIFIVSFNLIVVFSTLLHSLYLKLKIDMHLWILMPATYIFVLTIVKLCLTFFSPVLALQLGFLLYIQCFSIYTLNILNCSENSDLKSSIITKLKSGLWFTGIVFIFSFVRDILGYGTITLPSPSGIFAIRLFAIEAVPQMCFFASIPGAAILSALAIVLYLKLEEMKKEAKNE